MLMRHFKSGRAAYAYMHACDDSAGGIVASHPTRVILNGKETVVVGRRVGPPQPPYVGPFDFWRESSQRPSALRALELAGVATSSPPPSAKLIARLKGG